MAKRGGARRSTRTKLYYFAGRNTGIAAASASAARAKKKRGGDKVVAVRTPKRGEFGKNGTSWSRVRRDGKSPGKGRGQGPRRSGKR